jgi:hypothetical protein
VVEETKSFFFIVGAPKCGTTSIYKYLSSHPDIFMPAIKEPNYFSNEEVEELRRIYQSKKIDSLSEYLELFTPKSKSVKYLGEASVSYLYYPMVPKRIIDFSSHAKILIFLRDPTERAFSQYLMDKRLGIVKDSFETIFEKGKSKGNEIHYQQYFELGLYSDQVNRYLYQFGQSKVLIVIYDDIVDDLAKVLNNICSFLGINNHTDISEEIYNAYKWPTNELLAFLYKQKKIREFSNYFLGRFKGILTKYLFKIEKKPILTAESKSRLKLFYKKDIHSLEKIIGRKLSSWYE